MLEVVVWVEDEKEFTAETRRTQRAVGTTRQF